MNYCESETENGKWVSVSSRMRTSFNTLGWIH